MKTMTDEKMPEYLMVEISYNGESWAKFPILKKEFKTGSIGFYGFNRISNAENPIARYQANINLVLIGSKPA